jgi:hypothetical protein
MLGIDPLRPPRRPLDDNHPGETKTIFTSPRKYISLF